MPPPPRSTTTKINVGWTEDDFPIGITSEHTTHALPSHSQVMVAILRAHLTAPPTTTTTKINIG
jgi:hypothetical protein